MAQSKKPRISLKRGELLEIVAHAVELGLHLNEPCDIELDAHLPEVHSEGTRQIDTAIRFKSGGRDYLHIVEVQDRGGRMGSPMVDIAVGKAEAVGAHRVTLVAAAGFSEPSLNRIKHQYRHLIDPVELRLGKDEEWPYVWQQMRTKRLAFTGDIGDLQAGDFRHRRYIDALTKKPIFEILVGQAVDPERGVIVVCIILDSTETSARKAGFKGFFILGKGRLLGPDHDVTISFERTDGQTFSLKPTSRKIKAMSKRE